MFAALIFFVIGPAFAAYTAHAYVLNRRPRTGGQRVALAITMILGIFYGLWFALPGVLLPESGFEGMFIRFSASTMLSGALMAVCLLATTRSLGVALTTAAASVASGLLLLASIPLAVILWHACVAGSLYAWANASRELPDQSALSLSVASARRSRRAFVLFSACVAVLMVGGYVSFWYILHEPAKVTDLAKYQEMRVIVGTDVGEEAIKALPETIPAMASESRMYAFKSRRGFGSTLLLYCRFSPEEAARIASEARARVRPLPGPWSVRDPGFCQPGWQEVIPGAELAHDLPGSYEAFLLHRSGLSPSVEENNAGLLVDERAGVVVWWAHHRRVEFN